MRRRGLVALACAAIALAGCRTNGPVDIDTSADSCSRCRMAIDQLHHAGEIITTAGDVRKYDSLGCLALDSREGPDGRAGARIFVIDYKTGKWLDAPRAYYALASLPTDHMGYGVAAVERREDGLALVGGAADKVLSWADFLARAR